MTSPPTALRLHHHAYVVADQEVTRHFYEDILGLPLIATWCEVESLRAAVEPDEEGAVDNSYCHTFFGLQDGSALAFFQFSDAKIQNQLVMDTSPSLNHVAIATTKELQDSVSKRLTDAGLFHEVKDHGYCVSLYVNDPDGLRVEFTVDAENVEEINEWQLSVAHSELDRWMAGDHTANNDVRPPR